MPYRDENEALRQRVEMLEDELTKARETIARLEHPRIEMPREKRGLFGAPSRLELDQELPFEITENGYEAMAELLRTRLPPMAQLSRVGRTLTYRHGTLEVGVARSSAGGLRLRLRADHAHLGMFVAGTAFAAMVMAMPVVGASLGPAALIPILPLVGLVAMFVARALVTRSIDRNRAHLAIVFEEVCELAAQHALPGLRVANVTEENVATEEEENDDNAAADLGEKAARQR